MLATTLSLMFSIAIVVAISNGQVASACSCAIQPNPATGLAASTSVFEGRVAKIESGQQNNLVIFDVTQVWKGPISKTITVSTAANQTSCGYDFELGKQYIVYAYGSSQALGVESCGKTTTIENGTQDLAFLGIGAVPAPEFSSSSLTGLVMPIAIVAIVVGFGMLAKRKLIYCSS
jgi:hypothetical protein